MSGRVVQWLKPARSERAKHAWVPCDQNEAGARPFVYQGGYDELTKELGRINPETLRAFFENEDRWDAASWECRAQYFEFMAGLTRMFAPKEG